MSDDGQAPAKKKWGVGRWILVCFLLSIAYCGFKATSGIAGLKGAYDETQRRADVFHAQVAAGQCDAIYKAASDAFRKDVTSEQFDKLCKLIPTKLGAAKSKSITGWNGNSTSSGDFDSLQLATQFEKGAADESFDFSSHGGTLVLDRYRITSPLLAQP